MSDGVYRIFGSELSPYSVKVRSYFRYKGLPHEWLVRNSATQAEFEKYAKLPLVPLVITPDGQGMQDSSPLMEKLEAANPVPPVHPEDETLAFLSRLIEEYADEWGNKHMFHYRWWREPDQISAAERIAAGSLPDADAETVAGMAKAIRERMVPRLSFVGSSEATRPLIEASFADMLHVVEQHLATRPYLFGARPVFADFGLYAQLYEALTDPTAGEIIRQQAPKVEAWIGCMLNPAGAVGDLESWDSLAPTLEPLLAREIGGRFLPWSAANATALAAGEASFSVEIDGGTFSQETQKYHARSLGVLRSHYEAVSDKSALDPILERTGCLDWLR